MEVVRLHAFFESWFAGDPNASISDFVDALADDFIIVTPQGTERGKQEIVDLVIGARDSGTVAIAVELERLVIDGETVVGMYEEHQTRGASTTRRLSTAVMSRAQNTPGGWLWRLVHETWLPEDDRSQA